jgi:hypothetical protein
MTFQKSAADEVVFPMHVQGIFSRNINPASFIQFDQTV